MEDSAQCVWGVGRWVYGIVYGCVKQCERNGKMWAWGSVQSARVVCGYGVVCRHGVVCGMG